MDMDLEEPKIGKCCWCEQVKPIGDRVGAIYFCPDCLASNKSKAETMKVIGNLPGRV